MSRNYDYIIVGGGSSGAALAAVLALKGPTLLIERGANHTMYPQSTVSQGWPQIAALTYDRQINIGSGHWTGTANILGGGSALNGGTCWRGEKSVFRSMNLDLNAVEDAFRYIEDRICLPADDSEYLSVYVKAWQDSGLQLVDPLIASGYASWAPSSTTNTTFLNSSTTQGLGEEEQSYQGTIQKARTLMPTSGDDYSKRRPASALFEKSFVDDEPSILDQGNLTVYLLTKAKRLVFNDKKEAIGVDLESPSGNFTAYIRRQGKVFLNAGAYESPKLLMLSGIGPSELLSSLDIPLVHSNDNVGKNLIERKEMAALIPMQKELQGDDTTILTYASFTKDIWTTISHKFSIDWGISMNGCGSCAPENRTKSCAEQLFSSLLFYGINMQPSYFFSPIVVSQRRPRTRGFVTLASSDHNDDIIVNDGWSEKYDKLSEDALFDLGTIVNGTQDFISNLIRETNLLQDLGFGNITDTLINDSATFSADLMDALISSSQSLTNAAEMGLDNCTFASGFKQENMCTSWNDCVPTSPQLSSDTELLSRTVFDMLTSNHHMAGTCKAGDVVEKGSLAVKGVKGLYISDLSVLSQPVDIHPMLTAMSIGVVIGNSIESIPSGTYEIFPILLSLIFIFSALTLVCWIISTFFLNRKKRGLSIADYRTDEETSQEGEKDLFDDNPSVWKKDADVMSPDKSLQQETPPVSLMQWKHVSCTYVKGGQNNTSSSSVTTLHDNFGHLKEGELTAIMGPSGASKSTLLDILAGRKSLGKIAGNFSIFCQRFDADVYSLAGISRAIKGHSAYIPQQEFFYPTQTVEEAVAFAVNMKFGKARDVNERNRLIYSCLDAVGLDARTYSQRRIGGDLAGGISIRGLSGGERKRLALASVLALKPRLLFIDELTSGLDSENALIVMNLLKKLSIKQNVASMVIIHQPSPMVFSLFDNLILLSSGHCIYSGSCENLSTFYETNYDEARPMDAYIADDLITKASAFDTAHPLAYTCDSDIGLDEKEQASSFLELPLYQPPSWGFKLMVVFNRNLTNQYIRSITNVCARILSYSLLSLLVGAIFYKVGDHNSSTSHNNGLTFEEAGLIASTDTFLMNISYLLPFSTIPVFVCDKKFFAAESALGLYSPWIYGVSQIILEAIFVTIASIAQTCIVVPMCTMLNPAMSQFTSFLTILASIVTSGLVGSTVVFFCSMALPTQDLAFIVGSTIVTIALALSGGFLPFSEMFPLPYSIQWISPVKYSLQALLISQLSGTSAERLLDIAEYNSPSTVTGNLLALLAIFVFFSVMSVFAMIRVKERR